MVLSAFQRGAAGYLLKDGALEELVTALERILEGKRYISQDLHYIVADALMKPKRVKFDSKLEELSIREKQILSLIAGGNSRSDIAGKLHISPYTVKTHRRNLMAKLHIHKHADLVKFALEHGFGPQPL